MIESTIKPTDDDEYAYLVFPEGSVKQIPPDTVWAKIGDDGGLEEIRWDYIEQLANQYDLSDKNRSHTHVMCKLLVLVRNQTREECNGKAES